MKVSVLIIGFLIMGVMLTGFYAVTTDLGSSENGYNVNVDDDKYLAAFDKSNNISNEINSTYYKIQDLSANKASTIGIITLIPDVLIMIKNIIVLPFSLAGGVITSIQLYMGLPAWTTTFMLTLFVITLIFAFIALVLNRSG